MANMDSMVFVEVFNKQAAKHKSAVLHLTQWLVKELSKKGSVDVFLVGDSFMQKNVLAFPAAKDFPRPDLKTSQPLGEIYLNPKYIREHDENLEYMLVHGFLHLLGYDHIKKNDRIIMEREEARLLTLYASKH